MIKIVAGFAAGLVISASAQEYRLVPEKGINSTIVVPQNYINALAHGWNNNGIKAIKVDDVGRVICSQEAQ